MNAPEPAPYRLRVLTRCRVASLLLKPGQLLCVSRDRLQVAAWLCRNRSARPADRATAVDVDLFEALTRIEG